MGSGASVNSSFPKNQANSSSRREPRNTDDRSDVVTALDSLQGKNISMKSHSNEKEKHQHIVEIQNGILCPDPSMEIEADDVICFEIDRDNEEPPYDIIQVYHDGKDFYKAPGGYELREITSETPENQRMIELSTLLSVPGIRLRFCVIPSLQRHRLVPGKKIPQVFCEKNVINVHKVNFSSKLTDEQTTQKIFARIGDQIELEWSSSRKAYRIEKMKYCPVQGDFYRVVDDPNRPNSRATATGKFSITCLEYDSFFLVRFDESDKVHDITVIIVNDSYKVKPIKITETIIQPNLIHIDVGDIVEFYWGTKSKTTLVQIDPYHVHPNNGKSIELRDDEESFFWPYEPSNCGLMYHKFSTPGVFCFKANNNQIGTIIVENRKEIRRVDLLEQERIVNISTDTVLQFVWDIKMIQESCFTLRIDQNMSVIPASTFGLKSVFNCQNYKNRSTAAELWKNFQATATFLLTPPTHGIFYISHDDFSDRPMICIIVENGLDNHFANYDDEGIFEDSNLFANLNDQVWFNSSDVAGKIYETDENGNRINDYYLFEEQPESVNYFFLTLTKPGVFYYAVELSQTKTNAFDPRKILAIVVMKQIKFHMIDVNKEDFDQTPICTNIEDFVIWRFPEDIDQNMKQIPENVSLGDIQVMKNLENKCRPVQALAVECSKIGTFYFTNREFIRLMSLEELLISTIIVDPHFSEHCIHLNQEHQSPFCLRIQQNDTVSYIGSKTSEMKVYLRERVTRKNISREKELNRKVLELRKIKHTIINARYLHTFTNTGVFDVLLNNINSNPIGSIHVHSSDQITSQKLRITEPELRDALKVINIFGDKVALKCEYFDATIYYTIDGSNPKYFLSDATLYDRNECIQLCIDGLVTIRAFAMNDNGISSSVMNSDWIYVEASQYARNIQEQQELWLKCDVHLTSLLERPNKVYNSIRIEPEECMNLIDHYDVLVNDLVQGKIEKAEAVNFSVERFAADETYAIRVVAYPKSQTIGLEPKPSIARKLKVNRLTEKGAPLITITSPDSDRYFTVMWAHIGDSVEKYTLLVNNAQIKDIQKQEFENRFFVQLLDAKKGQKYVVQVEAKLENGRKLKSNVVCVKPPLTILKDVVSADPTMPYLIIVSETPSSTDGLEELPEWLHEESEERSRSSSISSSSHHIPNRDIPTGRTGSVETDSEEPPASTDQKDADVVQNQISAMQRSLPADIDRNTTEKTRSIGVQSSPREHRRKLYLSDEAREKAKMLLNDLSEQTKTYESVRNSRRRVLHDSYPENSDAPYRYLKPHRHNNITPITIAIKIPNAAPEIQYRRNPKGIALFWMKPSPQTIDTVKYYQIFVDDEPYGEGISPSDGNIFHVNLSPGKHTCYLQVVTKGADQTIYRSNTLSMEMPSSNMYRTDKDSNRILARSSEAVKNATEQGDLPVPKVNIFNLTGSCLRVKWHPDRPKPKEAMIALYEVTIRGHDFIDPVNSDINEEKEGDIEHVWFVTDTSLDAQGISDRHEYVIFVRAFYLIDGISEMKYTPIQSREISTIRTDPWIDSIPRPILKVLKLGIMKATLSWELDESTDRSLIKGYRIITDSKATEILSVNQKEYKITFSKPGTTKEIQVAVTNDLNFANEKVSEPIQINCPERPTPPQIRQTRASKPFSIAIEWNTVEENLDEIALYKILVDNQQHGVLQANNRRSFKYEISQLQSDRIYSVYVISVTKHKTVDGCLYQCAVESNPSETLDLKCLTPPKGTLLTIERMNPEGIELAWSEPTEYDQVQLISYVLLKDGKVYGDYLKANQSRVTVKGLRLGNKYTFQILPLTDQPGGVRLHPGDAYDPKLHEHYIPGPALTVAFTDMIQTPESIWTEKVSGQSAIICWSPIDFTAPQDTIPDEFELLIWKRDDNGRERAKLNHIPNEKTNIQVRDLELGTTYEFQLQSCKKRATHKGDDLFLVTNASRIVSFHTGTPPESPSYILLNACTNCEARFTFDAFVEHQAEIVTLRVLAEPISSESNVREISLDLTPDSTEFYLEGLSERTDYRVTVYAITEEYLTEIRCKDVSHLPKKLKSSIWLSQKSIEFTTAGYESSSNLRFGKATTHGIEVEWNPTKAYGSTRYLRQSLRWQLEMGEEKNMDVGRNATKAFIPGLLVSGVYKISLDTFFSIKLNLEDTDDKTSCKEIRVSTSDMVKVRLTAPKNVKPIEVHLVGYTDEKIDVAWYKPNLFYVYDHPEKNNEKIRIHHQLVGYRVLLNDQNVVNLDGQQERFSLTECKPGQTLHVRVISRTYPIRSHETDTISDEDENTREIEETPSEELLVKTSDKEEYIQSVRIHFELNGQLSDEQNNQLGKIQVRWKVLEKKKDDISHFILTWYSSKDLKTEKMIISNTERTVAINVSDEKNFYGVKLIAVDNNNKEYPSRSLTIPIPSRPDPPILWLEKMTDTSFTVEWSEPKSYGLTIIGFQLFVSGRKPSDQIGVKLRRAEIPSRINRTYEVRIVAITNHQIFSRSNESEPLVIVTTPTTSLVPTVPYFDDDGSPTSFDNTVARIIPLKIEPVNEERLHIDWSSFLPTTAVKNYYIHHSCLNTGETKAVKVPKRSRENVLKDLRPGFTYGIMVMAIDKNGTVLYTSDKHTIQMDAPPNAPIVAITERTYDHVKIEWRPAATYGKVNVIGYKIFVNNRLAAILSENQLSYTLMKGLPCETYTVHVQALSNDSKVVSPMSRSIQFSWPGIKPGAFRRVDDGQSGVVILKWDNPTFEDKTEKLLGYKLFAENTSTHAFLLIGEYEAGVHQANITNLHAGSYRIWLEIQGEQHCARARPIIVSTGRFSSLSYRGNSGNLSRNSIRSIKRLRSPTCIQFDHAERPIKYT